MFDYESILRTAWVEIDGTRLRDNIRAVQQRVGSSRIIGVAKANAYGHGAKEVAQAYMDCGVDMLAVISQSAIDTAALCVRLAGGYALFNGLISVMAACGVTQMLTRMLRTPLHWLFPGLQGNPAAQEAVSENLVANAVGLGNAATPAGLRAMRLMQEHTQICKDAATDDMCMLLVM